MHFASEALVSAAPERAFPDVHDRPCLQPERFACARRTIQRLAVRAGQGHCRAAEEKPEGRGAVRNRLRPVGPAAYRHFRRGRPHHHGAPRVSRADRGQDQDAAAGVFGRHGRPAQGAGQRAEQGDADGASRQAAEPDSGSVLERISIVRCAQQCAAARLSRHLRFRLRIRQLDRLLHFGKVRRGAAAHAGALRCGDGDHAAEPARGARGDLFAVPADLSAHRSGAAGADRRPRREGRNGLLRRSGNEGARDASGDRRPLQAAVEAGLGDALVRARRRL